MSPPTPPDYAAWRRSRLGRITAALEVEAVRGAKGWNSGRGLTFFVRRGLVSYSNEYLSSYGERP